MTLTPIKTLVVYRDLWVRGGKNNPTKQNNAALLNQHGMCCLGFVGLAVGVCASDLDDHGEPDSLGLGEIPGLVIEDDGYFNNSALAGAAMEINDDGGISGINREAGLIEVFADDGIALTFEDTAPPELRAQYEAGLK